MGLGRYALRRGLGSLPLLLGVTLVSFALMVYFGPDRAYALLGKNASAEQVEVLRQQLGDNQPFWQRYFDYLGDLASGDLGRSDASGEAVTSMLARGLPVTLLLVLPGYVIGNALGIWLGLVAARRRGSAVDRLVTTGSVFGMSLSLLVVVIALQVLLCTPYGLNLFPVRGWDTSTPWQYFLHVFVPTLSLVIITLGYNTRFYRAVFVEEFGQPHILAARAFGLPDGFPLNARVLRNAAVPVSTRLLFSIPVIVVTGSVLLESFFGIPGLGRMAFDAVTGGDQPVLKALVAGTAVAFIALQFVADLLVRALDPRVSDA